MVSTGELDFSLVSTQVSRWSCEKQPCDRPAVLLGGLSTVILLTLQNATFTAGYAGCVVLAQFSFFLVVCLFCFVDFPDVGYCLIYCFESRREKTKPVMTRFAYYRLSKTWYEPRSQYTGENTNYVLNEDTNKAPSTLMRFQKWPFSSRRTLK